MTTGPSGCSSGNGATLATGTELQTHPTSDSMTWSLAGLKVLGILEHDFQPNFEDTTTRHLGQATLTFRSDGRPHLRYRVARRLRRRVLLLRTALTRSSSSHWTLSLSQKPLIKTRTGRTGRTGCARMCPTTSATTAAAINIFGTKLENGTSEVTAVEVLLQRSTWLTRPRTLRQYLVLGRKIPHPALAPRYRHLGRSHLHEGGHRGVHLFRRRRKARDPRSSGAVEDVELQDDGGTYSTAVFNGEDVTLSLKEYYGGGSPPDCTAATGSTHVHTQPRSTASNSRTRRRGHCRL